MGLEFLSLSFMQNALIASSAAALSCGFLSPYIILRRIVFVSIVLAQLAMFGLAICLFFHWEGFLRPLVAFLFTLLGVFFMSRTDNQGVLPSDTRLGIGYAAFYAFSLLFLAKSSQGLEEVRHLMSGNILSVTNSEFMLLLMVSLLIMAFHILCRRSIIFVSFDSDFALVSGYSVRKWEFAFYAGLGLLISVALHVVGLQYVFACLVLPGAIALSLSKRMAIAQLIAVLSSLICTFVGLVLSFHLDLPTAEIMIAVQAIVFALVRIVLWIRGFYGLNRSDMVCSVKQEDFAESCLSV